MYTNPELTTATVEIFHDVEFERFDVNEILHGIATIASITGRLDVIKQRRQIRLASTEQVIDLPKVRWPQFDADINVILTGRSLSADDASDGETKRTDKTATLSAIAIKQRNEPDIIVLDMTRPSPSLKAQHELGHLFQKPRPLGQEHCETADCLMFYQYREKRLPGGVVTSLLERAKLTMPRFVPAADQFCDDCTQEIHHEGVRTALRKKGVYVP